MGCESLVLLTLLCSDESLQGPLLAGGQMDLPPAVGTGEPWAPALGRPCPLGKAEGRAQELPLPGQPRVGLGKGQLSQQKFRSDSALFLQLAPGSAAQSSYNAFKGRRIPILLLK